MTATMDRWIGTFDGLLRTVFAPPLARRAMPRPSIVQTDLAEPDRRRSAALMRVNHVGEVCAQGLYAGQAVATSNEALSRAYVDAGREEGDHLAWTAERLRELASRPSLLNPLWYAGSFGLGWLAGKAGDAVSLGFVVETERQVEAHLERHLDALPKDDMASRAVVVAMKRDEALHGQRARDAGAAALPAPVATAMRGVARVMTTTAYWI